MRKTKSRDRTPIIEVDPARGTKAERLDVVQDDRVVGDEHEMLDRGGPLEATQPGHADRSRAANTTQVVAQHVDDHHVLGPILGTGQELPCERAILFRHVLPNAAIPIITVLGLQVGYMLGGAIVVEMIFTLPGVGRMTLDAVLERNYPVAQSTVLVIGAMFMLVNLVTDILYGVIDPRVRQR